MKAKLLYITIAILTGVSYWLLQPYVTMQEPPQRYITVSNLTLNYVLFYAFIGGATYWLANKKLFKSRKPVNRTLLSAATTLVVALLFLILLSPWYQLR